MAARRTATIITITVSVFALSLGLISLVKSFQRLPQMTPCVDQLQYKVDLYTDQDASSPLAIGLANKVGVHALVDLVWAGSGLNGQHLYFIEIKRLSVLGLAPDLTQYLTQALSERSIAIEMGLQGKIESLVASDDHDWSELELNALRPVLSALQFVPQSDERQSVTRNETDHVGIANVSYTRKSSKEMLKSRRYYLGASLQSPKIASSQGGVFWGDFVDGFLPSKVSLVEQHRVQLMPDQWTSLTQQATWVFQAKHVASEASKNLCEIFARNHASRKKWGLKLDDGSPSHRVVELQAQNPDDASSRASKKEPGSSGQKSKELIDLVHEVLKNEQDYDKFGNLIDYLANHPELLTVLRDKILSLGLGEEQSRGILLGALSSVSDSKANEVFVEVLTSFLAQGHEKPLKDSLLAYQLASAPSDRNGVDLLGELMSSKQLPATVREAAVLALGSVTRRLDGTFSDDIENIWNKLRLAYEDSAEVKSRHLYLAAISNMRHLASVSWLTEIACCNSDDGLKKRAVTALVRIPADEADEFFDKALEKVQTDRSGVLFLLQELQVRPVFSNLLLDRLQNIKAQVSDGDVIKLIDDIVKRHPRRE